MVACPGFKLPEVSVLGVSLGGRTSNAASGGCRSIAQLIVSDLQTRTSMGDDMDPLDDCLSP
jgi:hypothetical protein